MRKIVLAIIILICSLPGLAQKNILQYQFSMDTSGAKVKLLVELAFRGTDSGITWLQLPGTWASQNELWKAVQHIAVINRGVSMDTTAGPAIRILRHRPGQNIRLRYALQQDWEAPLNYPLNYRAVINKQFVHFTGYSLFVFPKQDDSATVTVSLNWSRMPRTWNIANSLHTQTRRHRATMRQGDFINALYVAGDYRLHTIKIKDMPVYLAIRGNQWKFTDSAMRQAVEKVITAERDFWNDHTELYYLVTLTPFEGQDSYNGSALYQAFLTGATGEFVPDINLLGLLSHEYFHRWNGVAMSMAGNEQENAWFGEGFTEYYTYKLLYKSGLITLKEYVNKVNSSLADYYLSPVKSADKVTMGKNFWGSRDYQLLPYKKGFTYALYLEQLIKNRSAGKFSLDDLMFALLKAVQNKQPLTEQLFLDELKRLTGDDISAMHNNYIGTGNTIPAESGSLGPAVAGSLTQLAPFELGFDYEATAKSKTITGVAENSNAWKAGLRNGQQWRGGSIYFNNIHMPALVYIEADGKTKEISYKPMGRHTITVRQFYIKQP